jgi:hypothetical protein
MFSVLTDPQHGLISSPLPIDECPSFLQPVCVTWPHSHLTHFDPEEWGSKIFFQMLYGVTTHKTTIWTHTAVKTWKLTSS